MTDKAKKLVEALREDAEWAHANEWETPITLGDHLVEAADLIEKLNAQLVNQATEYGRALKNTTEQRDAAVADLNMCCPCEVCTRSCTYDKVNPYDECADFEWRGVRNDAE